MTQHLSRRAVAQGAAWAVPVVVVASAAPAMACSGPFSCTPDGCPVPDLVSGDWRVSSSAIVSGTGTTGLKNTWTPATGNNACTNVAGGSAAGTASNVVVGEGDPKADNGYLIYSKIFCYAANTTLSVSYQWQSYNTNRRAAYMQIYIEPYTGQAPSTFLATGGSTIGPQISAPAKTVNAAGSVTGATFTTGAAGKYMIKFVWTFDPSPAFDMSTICTYGTNDIGVHGAEWSCS